MSAGRLPDILRRDRAVSKRLFPGRLLQTLLRQAGVGKACAPTLPALRGFSLKGKDLRLDKPPGSDVARGKESIQTEKTSCTGV